VPEGDTVWRTARRLDEALAGAVLTRAELRWPTLAAAELSGARTIEIRSRGKHLLHRLDSGLTLHSHLRMDGQWRIEATAALTARRLADDDLRAVLGTATWTALGLRLGMLDLVPSSQEHVLVGHLGPDVLGEDWDPVRATDNLARATGTVGAALLDQRTLAGVGTMYAAESLFLERLPPWSAPADLARPTIGALVDRVHRLLDTGRQRAVPSTTGSTRRAETTYVHGRSGQACRRCGTLVRVATIGAAPHDRAMFYCPGCQGGLGPTDEGRPQRPLGLRAGGPPPQTSPGRGRRAPG